METSFDQSAPRKKKKGKKGGSGEKSRSNGDNPWGLFVTNFKISNKDIIPQILGKKLAEHNIQLNVDLNSEDSSFHYIGPPSITFPGYLINTQGHPIDKILKFGNGMFIFNQPIWIVKTPAPYFQFFTIFNQIFSESITEGICDLSDLKQKVLNKSNAEDYLKVVSLNNPDFAEFTLFYLGSYARESFFLVHTLVLQNNEIKYINEPMKNVVRFLPALRVLDLSNNPIAKQAVDTIPGVFLKTSDWEKRKNNNDDENESQFRPGRSSQRGRKGFSSSRSQREEWGTEDE
ncbi:hypothetical protein GPJ56_002083 [Histomonas meleagridis]|uniref:uncharacterized protein n=1 Tax=Histomonas meleagridis TaxID=135588 RepID=UPI003559E41F|nr:hypothetical protein GPJ56_002083 [Histomonas meleagridis]KAH0803635.1 hypothetical protein GO595_003600 [Histomonas meleagridis]